MTWLPLSICSFWSLRQGLAMWPRPPWYYIAQDGFELLTIHLSSSASKSWGCRYVPLHSTATLALTLQLPCSHSSLPDMTLGAILPVHLIQLYSNGEKMIYNYRVQDTGRGTKVKNQAWVFSVDNCPLGSVAPGELLAHTGWVARLESHLQIFNPGASTSKSVSLSNPVLLMIT